MYPLYTGSGIERSDSGSYCSGPQCPAAMAQHMLGNVGTPVEMVAADTGLLTQGLVDTAFPRYSRTSLFRFEPCACVWSGARESASHPGEL